MTGPRPRPQTPRPWQAVCLLGLLLPACTGQAGAAELGRLWREARAPAPYVQPPEAELRAASGLFRRELLDPAAPGLSGEWTRLKMRRVDLRIDKHACHLVMETPGNRRGRGLYLFCPNAPRAVALQLPHGFKDTHTGHIGLKLAVTGAFALVAWNTVPRHYRDQGLYIDADLAHLPGTYFTALTRAIAATGKLHQVVQLHGFSQAKRKSAVGRAADFILSTGRREVSPAVEALAGCLRGQGQQRVRVYPREVHELGALSNREGALLRETGATGFIHVEMSAEVRKTLAREAAARQRLLECLPR